jgi:hypothetical protein
MMHALISRSVEATISNRLLLFIVHLGILVTQL